MKAHKGVRALRFCVLGYAEKPGVWGGGGCRCFDLDPTNCAKGKAFLRQETGLNRSRWQSFLALRDAPWRLLLAVSRFISK